ALPAGGAAQPVAGSGGTGSFPLGMAANPVTNKVYVANSGSNAVTVFNGATGATNTIAISGSPQDVAVNPLTNRIYVTNSNGVTVIDGGSDTVITTVAAGANPTAVVVNAATNQIYVANTGDTTVTAIDGATNTP